MRESPFPTEQEHVAVCKCVCECMLECVFMCVRTARLTVSGCHFPLSECQGFT